MADNNGLKRINWKNIPVVSHKCLATIKIEFCLGKTQIQLNGIATLYHRAFLHQFQICRKVAISTRKLYPVM